MKLHTFPTVQVTKEAAKALNSLFTAQKGKNFLFLSSGGSSLKLLEEIDVSHFGPSSTIAVLDERYSEDPETNNFAQLRKTEFYKATAARGAHFIDSRPLRGESIGSFAARFEQKLKDWTAEAGADGEIIASAGVGPDAHTSGIMPYPENHEFFDEKFDAADSWIAFYDAQGKNPHRMRITTTFPFLRKIGAVVVYITGEAKRPALEALVSENGTLYESPCRVWRELADPANAEIYTDIVF